jgi:hypothetical protein
MIIPCSPHLFTSLAANKRQAKVVVQAATRGAAYPQVLKGQSKVKRVALLSRVVKAEVYRPSVEKLHTPAMVQLAPRPHIITSYPQGGFKFCARVN